jgi:hypothetical protein
VWFGIRRSNTICEVGLNKNKQWNEWFEKAQDLRSERSRFIKGSECMNEDTEGHAFDYGGEK